MVPSYVSGSTPAGVSLDSGTYPNANVNFATFQLDNPSPCPMNVTDLKFVTHPERDPSSIFTPLQNMKIIVASTGAQFGTTVKYTSGWDQASGTWVTPADTVGSVAFSGSAIVPPFGSEQFNFVADGRNVVSPNSVQIQLTEFDSVNTVFTGMTDDEVYPTSMAMIESPVVPWSL